jgi:beta-galactosidase
MKRVFLAMNLMVAVLLTSCVHGVREKSSFNDNWKFSRFGIMPDGTTKVEPGGVTPNYIISASSEAIERDGAVSHIADGDQSTFWNSAGHDGEWVAVDFRMPHKVSGVWIKWGFADAPGITVDVRAGKNQWKRVVDLENNKRENDIKIDFPTPVDTKGVRINLVKMAKSSWPRIGEVIIFDEKGKKIPFDMNYDKRLAPQKVKFDDSKWENIEIPHDWAISGPFSNKLDHATGLLPWKGLGWYRKSFLIPESDKGKKIFLDFDGAMANSKVYLNGKLVGGWPYGYNSFRVDLTPEIKYGKENKVAVRLDTENWGSRWYPGAGIYRNVWLVKTAPVYVPHWGVFVTTPEVSKEKAVANFAVTLKNSTSENVNLTAEVVIKTPEGGVITTKPKKINLLSGKKGHLNISANIADPQLWDIENPNLYHADILLKKDGALIDKYPVVFGVRTIKFTARDGFFLNGKRVQIKGVCNHHDLGPLGAAVNKRAIERQLEILKTMGCNAVRTSHNPPAPELLDLCDKMGFLVMDEAFDCWKRGKRNHDYGEIFDKWHKKDLNAMVKRDRNHPSVIIWSIGNEVPDQHNAKMAKMLRDIVHNTDSSRPVTFGTNSGRVSISPVAQAIDMIGLNYNLGFYSQALNKKENRNTPLIATETSSCISSRGEYFFPVGKHKRADFQITSYDIDYPGWGCSPDKQFEMLEKYPAVVGEFVWTGFDYIGEPTPYNSDATVLLNFSSPQEKERQQKALEKLGKIKVPSRSSYFGIIDICGFPKDRFFLYQSHWRPDFPMAHILPHWNWTGRMGEVTPVHVYTSGDEAELFLNGKSLGRRKKEKYQYRLKWENVLYQPGELKVVAYKNGKKWAEDIVCTTGKPAALKLQTDRSEINSHGDDLAFITLRVVDKNGLTVPTADIPVKFSVEGPGEIVATGSGNAASQELFKAHKRRTFNGLALVIVKAKAGETGTIKINALSRKVGSAEITVTVK